MSELLKGLDVQIQERRLFLRGQKILVAVSGGLDSMSLLHALYALAGKSRWKITVAHFNHQLRGRSSNADENLVRKTATALGLPFVCGRADVKRFAQESKLSVEMAARKLRHEFFARVAQENKITVVALAHHADDQVEHFFLRVLRGAGGDGVAGMKWRAPSPVNSKIALIRPSLGFSKTELREFARENKIRFREDATNAQLDAPRNRVRNELLPLLREKYQPGLNKTVLRLMEIIGAEAEFVGAQAQAWLDQARRSQGGQNQIKSGKQRVKKGKNLEATHIFSGTFEQLPVAVQRKVLQQQLTGLGVVLDFELVERLRRLAGAKVSAGYDFSLVRDAAGTVSLRREAVKEFNFNEMKISLSGRPGQNEFGGREFRWQIKRQKMFARPRNSSGREFFDADKIGGEIILRHWRAGDRFQPIGLPSPVKLQDLFVNAKIPAAKRRDLILAATAASEIFWVEGLRIGEQFKLTPKTVRQLVWNHSI